MKSSLSYLPLVSGLSVLVLSLAVGVLTVTSRNSATSQNIATKAAQNTASLSLSPATGDYAFTSGTSYPVGIIIDTAGKAVDGVDVVISFDPLKVKIIDTKVATTSMFETIPENSIDSVKGKIKLSGLTFSPKAQTGIVGTFRFQPLAKGEVSFNFDFINGSTTDSNIADSLTAQDILGSAIGGKYTFK